MINSYNTLSDILKSKFIDLIIKLCFFFIQNRLIDIKIGNFNSDCLSQNDSKTSNNCHVLNKNEEKIENMENNISHCIRNGSLIKNHLCRLNEKINNFETYLRTKNDTNGHYSGNKIDNIYDEINKNRDKIKKNITDIDNLNNKTITLEEFNVNKLNVNELKVEESVNKCTTFSNKILADEISAKIINADDKFLVRNNKFASFSNNDNNEQLVINTTAGDSKKINLVPPRQLESNELDIEEGDDICTTLSN